MSNNDIDDNRDILEAVNNLSSMTDIDVAKDNLKNKREKINSTRWLDPSNQDKMLKTINATFKVVRGYLKKIHSKGLTHLKDPATKRGVLSIMKLVEEACEKMEENTQKKEKKLCLKRTKEYQALMDFYEKKIAVHFSQKDLSEDVVVEMEFFDDEEVKKRGIQDVNSVIQDDNYELFFLKREDGGRFYTMDLIRHIRLVSDFDALLSDFSILDPLTKIPLLKDELCHNLCMQIKYELKEDLDKVVKSIGKYRDDILVQNVFRAIMALMLGANMKNQLKVATGKCAYSYFKDFQYNLRAVLSSIDYRNYIDNPPRDEFYGDVLTLLHDICYVIYTARIETSQVGSLIATFFTSSKKKSTRSSVAFLNHFLDEYESIKETLRCSPSGPVFKVLDIINEGDAFLEFDPIMQDDLPGSFFEIKLAKKSVTCLKVPSPTMQVAVHEADLNFEFAGFLRAMMKKQETVLLINFQDKTSWKDYARIAEIENKSMDAELEQALTVITFAKSTDFYFQINEYLDVNAAKDFKKTFFLQLEGEDSCGFHFPQKYKRKQLQSFFKKVIEDVHSVYFGAKKSLSRKNRLDFIEIVYHYIYLFFILEEEPTFVGLSGKDGVDMSSSALVSMFGFLKFISGEIEWKVEEEEFIEEIIYSSPLIVRERAPNERMVLRVVNMLAVMVGELEVNKKAIVESSETLFGKEIKKLKVHRISK